MKKKRSGNRTVSLIVVFLCVALVFAAIWGIVTGFAKLMHYGENTMIQQEPVAEETLPEEMIAPEEQQDVLPKNQFYADKFYEHNGIRYYSDEKIEGVPGIDVSSYQPMIDWQQVRDAGIEFVMLRVGYRGYTSGELTMDKDFASHLAGATEAGLDLGIYFFSQALTPEEAVEEAEYVLECVDGLELAYPIYFDWEEVQAEARTDEMNMLMLTSCALAFCERIEQAGYRAGIYFNQAYGYQQLNLVSLKDYDFWLAEYDAVPTFAYDVQMWQYTDQGAVPGIDGNVDLNIAFRMKEE